jgi:hypothetical protein
LLRLQISCVDRDFHILHVKIYYGDVGIDMDKLKLIWNKTEINYSKRFVILTNNYVSMWTIAPKILDSRQTRYILIIEKTMNKSRKCQVIGSVDFIPVQKVDRKKHHTVTLSAWSILTQTSHTPLHNFCVFLRSDLSHQCLFTFLWFI